VKWFFGALLLLIGILAGWFLPAVTDLRFSKEIDAGNFLVALVTLIVAFVIGYLYTESVSSKRSNTELLLECVREARAMLVTLQSAALPCHRGKKLTLAEQASLTMAERELSNSIHSLELAVGLCGAKAHRLDFEKLKDARIALKDSLTDTPFPGPYGETSRSRITAAFKIVRDELLRVSFAITRR
jgi:hypothetical protein